MSDEYLAKISRMNSPDNLYYEIDYELRDKLESAETLSAFLDALEAIQAWQMEQINERILALAASDPETARIVKAQYKHKGEALPEVLR